MAYLVGWSKASIGVAQAIMVLGLLAFEVPSGFLADRWSRKRVLQLGLVSLLVCSILVVSQLDVRSTFFFSIPMIVLSIVALQFFKEPMLQTSRSFSVQSKDTLDQIVKKPELHLLVASVVLAAVVIRVLFGFSQVWWIDLNVNPALFGLFFAGVGSSRWLAGFLVMKIRDSFLPVFVLLAALISVSLVVKNLLMGMSINYTFPQYFRFARSVSRSLLAVLWSSHLIKKQLIDIPL